MAPRQNIAVHLGQEKASSTPPWNQEIPLAPWWRVPAGVDWVPGADDRVAGEVGEAGGGAPADGIADSEASAVAPGARGPGIGSCLRFWQPVRSIVVARIAAAIPSVLMCASPDGVDSGAFPSNGITSCRPLALRSGAVSMALVGSPKTPLAGRSSIAPSVRVDT
jgi:hypothetical protein